MAVTPDYIKNHRWMFPIDGVSDSMWRIKEWKEYSGKEFLGITRYIQFMYSKDSPFIMKFRDLKKRKEECLSESGVSKGLKLLLTDMSEEIPKDAKRPTQLEMIADMITGFLLFQNDRLWAQICIHESLWAEYSSVLLTGIRTVNNDKDLVAATNAKEKTREALNSVSDDLERLYDRFYNKDSEIKEKIERIKFTPEGISGKII